MERRSTLSERANLQFFEVFDIKPAIHEYPLLRTVPHSRGRTVVVLSPGPVTGSFSIFQL